MPLWGEVVRRRGPAALPWMLAAYGAMVAFVRGVPWWIQREAAHLGVLEVGVVGAVIVLGWVWAQANQRWHPHPNAPSPLGPWRLLWGWSQWASLWLGASWGILGVGYQLHTWWWGDTGSLVLMGVLALMVVAGLSLFGTVASASHSAPTWWWMIQQVRRSPHIWARIWLQVMAGDGIVVGLTWALWHVGLLGKLVGVALPLLWSIGEPILILDTLAEHTIAKERPAWDSG